MTNAIFFILLALTLIGFSLLMVMTVKQAKARKKDILNKLLLVQYRFQCDPHTHLNRINSLAALPGHLKPAEMQKRLLDFGKQLRDALVFSREITQVVNQQIEEVNRFVEQENRPGISTVVMEVTLQNQLAGWLQLPSFLLVNIVHGIVRARENGEELHIGIELDCHDTVLIVRISHDPVTGVNVARGIAAEFLQMQLEYFNSLQKGSLRVDDCFPLSNLHPVTIGFKNTNQS